MEARIVEMAFLVSRCTVIHNNKAQRACTGTTFLSRSIPGRGKRNEKCSLSDAVWRCTLLAGRCFVSFLSFIGIQQIGIQFLSFFFYSLFHFEVSIFLSIIGIEKIFLFIFFVRVSSRSAEHVAPTISKSVEFYMEFYMEWISIRVW